MHKSADVSTKSPRQPRLQNMDLDKDKVHRKVKRKQAQYLKQEPKTDIGFQEEPSVHLFIGNGGLKNGVPREVLEHMLNPLQSEGYLKQLYLPSGKDYAFVTFTSTIIASQCLVSLNGVCIVEVCRSNESLLQSLPPALLHGPPVHLYMSYVNKIPSSILGCGVPKRTECSQVPPGLILLEDFVSIQEEDQLLNFFSFESETKQTLQPNRTTHGIVSANDEPQQTAIVVKRTEGGCSPPKATLKHRQVMHFGYEFLYGSNLVDPNNPLPGRLPAITHPLLDRMMEQGLITHHPDQLTVNRYNPGAGIPSHVDTHSVFQGPIISLSLGSQVVMEFKHPTDGKKVPLLLPPRSLLVMNGEARYLWGHGIPARTCDEVFLELLGYWETPSKIGPQASNVLPRSTRTSLTFRKIRPQPSICTCDYPLQCDSQNSSV